MIVGHQKQFQFLHYMAATGQLPHALLFSGEEQIGKRTVALELVKTLHCERDAVQPCQKCPVCLNIGRGVYSDLFLVRSQDNAEIKIAQVKDIGNFLSLRSGSGKSKFVIIDNAHRMTVPAQQAFLKTLEEPRGSTIIILVTAKPYLLLPTVLSRVQQIKFFLPLESELIDFLQTKGIFESAAKDIVKLSARRPGAILEFLADKKNLKRRTNVFKELQELCRADLQKRFKWARDMAKEPRNIPETLELWLRFFRGLIIMRLQGKSGGISTFAAYSLDHLRKIIATLQEVEFALANANVNPRLALDVLMLEL